MKVLVTGAKGFVGRNLCEALKAIKDGKDHSQSLVVEAVYEIDRDSTDEELNEACSSADFVFNLAGVNRPDNTKEFMEGNHDFLRKLLASLKQNRNRCPVMLSSSIQATLLGRYQNSPYGLSKLAAENELFAYGKETGSKVLIYRFPNLYGKWCRPNYNSVIATFCHNLARDLEIQVNDPNVELELVYIDDLVRELLLALEGREHRCDYFGLESQLNPSGKYCVVPKTHRVTLGQIVKLLRNYVRMIQGGTVPEMAEGSFEKNLCSTFLSYLPKDKVIFDLKMNCDDRGSFTELIHTLKSGQISVNISKPGVKKGEHWHHSKWEQFIVVSGHGLIQMRREGSEEILNYEVSGSKIQSVMMLPGYTHNIINLSETEDLVTVMYCNEIFDPKHPDTFRDPVELEK